MRAEADAEARPLLAWRPVQLDEVRTAFEAACRAWSADWGLSFGGAVSCRNPDAADLGNAWQCLGGAAWIHCPPEFPDSVAQDLFGAAPATSPIALSVVAECIANLRLHVCRLLKVSPDPGGTVPGAEALHPWSGWIRVALPAGVMVLLDGRIASALMSDRTDAHRSQPLHALMDALGESATTLQVQLHGCELDLGSLREIQPGDVLRVPHGLGEPATVVDTQGRALFSGLLVSSGGRKAVELIARA